MNITLLSCNGEVAAACRRLAEQLNITFNWAKRGDCSQQTHIAIHDFSPGDSDSRTPPRQEWMIHLVSREDLKLFREKVGPEARVCLKPLNETLLKTHLSVALEYWQRGEIGTKDSWRAFTFDCDLRIQEMEQERVALLASVVHDFRVPLTALNGYCGMALDGRFGVLQGPQAEVLRRMNASVQRLSRMSSAIYDVTQDEPHSNGDAQGRGEDFAGAVEQALAETSFCAAEKRIRISAQFEMPDRRVVLDEERIVRVLVNLIENACKFSPRDSEVTVRGYNTGEERTSGGDVRHAKRNHRTISGYRIDVVDRGPGIPVQHAEAVFQERFRLTRDRGRSGTGLGLFICRKYVAACGGAIWVDPSTEGGCRISLALPFVAEAAGRTKVTQMPRPGFRHHFDHQTQAKTAAAGA